MKNGRNGSTAVREQKVKYLTRRILSVQVLKWQIHIRSLAAAAAEEARETPCWEHRWWSKDWAAEQHVQGVKKPITVNQASAASQGGKEGKLYTDFGPRELACRVQRGGKSTGCHIHLDFYECFDSSPKGTPLTRWRVFIQACQKSKIEGKDICWSPLLRQKKNLAVILIATGNNYLAVDSGKRVTWIHPALITRCELLVDGCDWRTAVQLERNSYVTLNFYLSIFSKSPHIYKKRSFMFELWDYFESCVKVCNVSIISCLLLNALIWPVHTQLLSLKLCLIFDDVTWYNKWL